MPYWELVTRSFRIAWDHKYLWLIALFAGEGGGFGFNYSQGTRQTGATRPDFARLQEQVSTWISDHLGLILIVAAAWLLLAIAFFILAALCEGATVRASAEHDADRPFRLGSAWHSGVTTMWTMIRFRLLILVLGLPVFLIALAFAAGIVLSIASNRPGLTAILILLSVLVGLAAIAYLIYLGFLDRFGARAVVLEQLMARAAIVRAHSLLRKRLGRSLVVWVVSIAVTIAVGIVAACFFLIAGAPLLAIGIALSAGGATPVQLLPLILIAVVVLTAISLVVGGFLAAQASTYWTLAFRRLDLEYATAAAPAPAPR